MKFVVPLLLTLIVLLQTGKSLQEEPKNALKLNNKAVHFDTDAYLSNIYREILGEFSRPASPRPRPPRRPRGGRGGRRRPSRPTSRPQTIAIEPVDIRDERICNKIKQEKLKTDGDVWAKCNAIENANGELHRLDHGKCEQIQKLYGTVSVREEVKTACTRILLDMDGKDVQNELKAVCEKALNKTGETPISEGMKSECIKLVDGFAALLNFRDCENLGILIINTNTEASDRQGNNNAPTTTIKSTNSSTTITKPTTPKTTRTVKLASPLPSGVSKFVDKCSEIQRVAMTTDENANDIVCDEVKKYKIPKEVLQSTKLDVCVAPI